MKKVVALCMCMVLAPAAAWAQADQHQHGGMAPKDIGTVNFETSCAPAVKDRFNEAVALLHSFWFQESRDIFNDVLKQDANCAMAHWGIALTYWGNPFGGQRSPQVIANGKGAIDKGLATGSPTPREKAYIDAMVKGHQEALSLIDDRLLPAAQDTNVRTFLTNSREHVAMHLERAKALQQNAGATQ